MLLPLRCNYNITNYYDVNVIKKITMDTTDLINGNKQALIGEFKRLYPYHARKWRSVLKKHNPWHATDKGLRAWQNISNGTTGNEALRLIIGDMKKVIAGTTKSKILKKHGFSNSKTL